ncbi:hypothetical protein ACEWY4_009980 [Coilia grayii]|uniref:RING-type domain-containing protein n=1 Tax=Coilia grayii TaxID=363190 RepID=A0ABD1K813_9TELE
MKNKGEMTSSANQETAKQVLSISAMKDKAVNTDPDWETKMRLLEEETKILTQEYDDIRHQHEVEAKEHKQKVKNLQQMIDDKKSQHQTLLDKLGSLHLKLEHSNRKAHQKKFLAKKEALLTELGKIEDKGKSLTEELEAKKEALRILEEEHEQEKETLQQEIADLRKDRDRLKKEVEEAEENAIKEEIAALELQREVYMSELEEWMAEADKHIKSLRRNPLPEYLHQSLEWERKMATMRTTMSSLQEQFNKMIQQIQHGQTLEDLPTVSLPPLPEIPVLLYFSQPTHPVPVPVSRHGLYPGRPGAHQMPLFHPPHPQMSPPAGSVPQPIGRPVPTPAGLGMPALHPVLHAAHRGMAPPHRSPGPGPVSTVPQRSPLLPTPTPPLASTASAATTSVPAQPPQPSQLDKVLQMLGARLPTRSRVELTGALQQVKGARGTLAGMAMEELCQQVAERLDLGQKAAMRPIGHPPVVVPPQMPKVQQPPHLHQAPLQPPHLLQAPPRHPHLLQAPPQRPHLLQGLQPPPQHPQSVPNLCLVCQGQVDEHTRYKMRCSHIIHKQCVLVWLQSGTKKECPICPD